MLKLIKENKWIHIPQAGFASAQIWQIENNGIAFAYANGRSYSLDDYLFEKGTFEIRWNDSGPILQGLSPEMKEYINEYNNK